MDKFLSFFFFFKCLISQKGKTKGLDIFSLSTLESLKVAEGNGIQTEGMKFLLPQNYMYVISLDVSNSIKILAAHK